MNHLRTVAADEHNSARCPICHQRYTDYTSEMAYCLKCEVTWKINWKTWHPSGNLFPPISTLILHIHEDEYPAVFWHIGVVGRMTDEDIASVRAAVIGFTSKDDEPEDSQIHKFVLEQLVALGYKIADSQAIDIPCFAWQVEEK